MRSSSSRKRCGARALCAALVAAVFGAALMANAGAPAPAPAPAQVEIRMQGEKFVPDYVKIKSGTTVRWINTEKRTSHSVHFAAEGLPESERLFPGESWQRKFDKPGTFPYVCGPHPAMKGIVEVVE